MPQDFCGIQDGNELLKALRTCKSSLDFLLKTGKAHEIDIEGQNLHKIMGTTLSIDGVEIKINDVHHAVFGAREAQSFSYAPYSHFNVGAAIATPKAIIGGCNVENAAYGSTICAERTAAFAAVSQGQRKFKLVGIIGGFDFSMPPELRAAVGKEYVFPCGCCRQVLNEFGGENLVVAMAKDNLQTFVSLMKYLLPSGFGPQSLRVDASKYSRFDKKKE